MSNLWKKRSAGLGLLLALAAHAGARPQNSDTLFPAENCDGTLWFRAIGAAVSDGSAQLGVYDGGAGGGLHWSSLAWNHLHLWLTRGVGAALLPTQEVFQPGMGMVPIAPCLGVATLQGGFIVTTDPNGGTLAINEHVGAFAWDQQQLYAIENFGGIITRQALALPGVQGVAVLASRTEDINPAPTIVNSELVASALVYTAAQVVRVNVTMQGGAIILGGAVPVLTPAGAAIGNLRGVTVVNSAFDPAVMPSDPQGAAYIWDANNVWFYRHPHPMGADFTIQVVDPIGGNIAGCWGVMPVFFKAFPAAALPAAPPNKVMIWDLTDAFMASGNATTQVADPLGAPLTTGVGIAANPLIKRQASFLYENQGTSSVSHGRGMVIGLNQRTP